MAVILDTSLLIAYERGLARLPEDEEYAVAAITVSELLDGVHRATAKHRPQRETIVEGILSTTPVIAFDTRVARVHARLWADAEASGRRPGAHDLLVAATAVAVGYPLVTLDRKAFAGIRGLTLRSAG